MHLPHSSSRLHSVAADTTVVLLACLAAILLAAGALAWEWHSGHAHVKGGHKGLIAHKKH